MRQEPERRSDSGQGRETIGGQVGASGSLAFRSATLFPGQGIDQGVVAARPQTVETAYTPAGVGSGFLCVDAGRLAVPGALAAIDAVLGVDTGTQQGKAAAKAQERAYRAERIAPGAARPEGKNADDAQAQKRGDQGGQPFLPDRCRTYSEVLRPGRDHGQEIAPELPHRYGDIRGDAPEGAVRLQKGKDERKSGHKGEEENRQRAEAQPVFLRRETIPAFFAEPGDTVLQHAKWTDGGTIDASEKERQKHKRGNDGYTPGQYGRNELYFGEKSQFLRQYPAHIQKQKANPGEAQNRQARWSGRLA